MCGSACSTAFFTSDAVLQLYRLNILAELLRFGDHEFYKDWRNAQTVEVVEYWRMWNMPVHKWMVRHVYFPCLWNGISKGVSVVIAFIISAIFNELCIAVPCHMFKLWAFIGIMFQSRNSSMVLKLIGELNPKDRSDRWDNLLNLNATPQYHVEPT